MNLVNASSVGLLSILLIVFIIGVWVGLALIPAFIAKKKGYPFAGYFLLSLLFSFLTGLVVSLCLPNRKNEMQALLNAIKNHDAPLV